MTGTQVALAVSFLTFAFTACTGKAPTPASESAPLTGPFEGYWVEDRDLEAEFVEPYPDTIEITQGEMRALVKFMDGPEEIPLGKVSLGRDGALRRGSIVYRLNSNGQLERTFTRSDGSQGVYRMNRASRKEAERAVKIFPFASKQDYAIARFCGDAVAKLLLAQAELVAGAYGTTLSEIQGKRAANGEPRNLCEIAEDLVERDLRYAVSGKLADAYPGVLPRLLVDSAKKLDLSLLKKLELDSWDLGFVDQADALGDWLALGPVGRLSLEGAIFNERPEAVLSALNMAHWIRELELRDAAIPDFASLRDVSGLESLNILGSVRSEEALSRVGELKKLKRLEISLRTPIKSLAFLDSLTELESLTLNEIAEDQVQHVVALESLRDLRIGGASLTPAMLERLEAVKLRSLGLVLTGPQKDLSLLARFEGLRRLELRGDGQELSGFDSITRLEKLARLTLTRFELTDDSGLTRLLERNRGLRVRMYDIMASLTIRKKLESLVARYPGALKISFSDGATK